MNDQNSDGSAIGWAVLAYITSNAFGVEVPDFAGTEFAFVTNRNICLNGSFSYDDPSCYVDGLTGNVAKTGILLQTLSFMRDSNSFPAPPGVAFTDSRVQGVLSNEV